LVHEAWLRLVGGGQRYWNSRGHFFAAAAEAMRRIVIEAIRRKQSQQRGGQWQRIELDESTLVLERPAAEMLDIDAALEKLAREDALAADLVKLRYFVGLTVPEAAEALNISARTADRLWAYARSWLRLELEHGESA
jgi:RNA polymerase sigma factor (TIGR02999 family)